jgi:hypothetical protein
MESSVYLGRQPIYGPNREIRAYELLYRRAIGDDTARISDGNQASAEVILKAILEIGLGKVAPERPVFINHTRDLLAMKPVLPPDRCVVEVLEDIVADAETVQAIRRLKQLNYRIALDDFVFRSPTTSNWTTTPWAPPGSASRRSSCARSMSRWWPKRLRARPNSAGPKPKAASFSRGTTFASLNSWWAGAFPRTSSRCFRWWPNAPTWKPRPA